jgi:hypothetical protein
MIKSLIIIASLVALSAALFGCHAEADIHPNSQSNLASPL